MAVQGSGGAQLPPQNQLIGTPNKVGTTESEKKTEKVSVKSLIQRWETIGAKQAQSMKFKPRQSLPKTTHHTDNLPAIQKDSDKLAVEVRTTPATTVSKELVLASDGNGLGVEQKPAQAEPPQVEAKVVSEDDVKDAYESFFDATRSSAMDDKEFIGECVKFLALADDPNVNETLESIKDLDVNENFSKIMKSLLSASDKIKAGDSFLKGYMSEINEKIENKESLKNLQKDYYTAVNGGKLSREISGEISGKSKQCREKIENQLDNPDSQLSEQIRGLSLTDKTRLYKAVVTNDVQVISELLSQAIGENDEKILGGICAHDNSDGFNSFLNSTQEKILKTLLTEKSGSNIPDKDIKRIAVEAMNTIPDTQIHVRVKGLINKSVGVVTAKFVHYSEPVKPLAEAKSKGVTSLKQFNAASKHKTLTDSEFIMLSLGLLEKATSNPNIKERVDSIRNMYIETNFEDAITEIRSVCNEYKNEIGESASNAILEHSDAYAANLSNKDSEISDDEYLQAYSDLLDQMEQACAKEDNVVRARRKCNLDALKEAVNDKNLNDFNLYIGFTVDDNEVQKILDDKLIKKLIEPDGYINDKRKLQAIETTLSKMETYIKENSSDDKEISKKKNQCGINDIRESVAKGDLSEALGLLGWVVGASEQKIKDAVGQELFEEFSSITKSDESDVDTGLAHVDITRNYSRRFLENRLAALYFGSENFQQEGIGSINRIASHYLGDSFDDATTIEEAIHVLVAFPEAEDSKEVHDTYLALRQEGGDYYVPHFGGKKRMQKEGFSSKEGEVDEATELEILAKKGQREEVFSRNTGVMRSFQPNFQDEITAEAMRNRVVDIVQSEHVDKPALKGGTYGGQNERSAYAGDISGHTAHAASMLYHYALAHKDDSDDQKAQVQNDVNSFLTSFVGTYIAQGYHSYLECMHVLESEQMGRLFESAGVELNISLPDEVVAGAFKDTQEYTKGITLQKAMRQDLADRANS